MSHSLFLAGRTTISDFSEQRQKVLDRFQASRYGALRLIHCTCDGSGIVLRGRVPSYYLKQLAQALASEATDVQRIDNQLDVKQAYPGECGGRNCAGRSAQQWAVAA